MRLFFRWKQIVLTLGLVFVFSVPLAFLFTSSADAAILSGIVPCGMQEDDVSTADSEENSPCTLCHLVIGVKRVVDWGLMIMTYFAIMVIVAMGILYIISVGDTKMTGLAKDGLKATLYGFALMLLIWLFVGVVLMTLARPLSDFKTGAMWWQFTCSTKSNVGTFDNGGGGNGGAVTPPGGGSGNGKCEVITGASEPCSEENLKKTCFGAKGDNVVKAMSQICNVESKGNPLNDSGTDHCGKGGPTVSGGLFQINITNSGGSECNGSAVPPLLRVSPHGCNSESCWYDANCGTKSINTSLIASCMNKTHTADWNIKRACYLYEQRGYKPWSMSARKCGFL